MRNSSGTAPQKNMQNVKKKQHTKVADTKKHVTFKNAQFLPSAPLQSHISHAWPAVFNMNP